MLISKKNFFRPFCIIGLLFSISSCTSISLQARINQELIDTFYLQLYNYRFLSADSSLKKILLTEQDQGITDLLEVTYQWWLIISGENGETSIDPLLKKIDKAIVTIEHNHSSKHLPQDKLLQLIVLYSYKSRIHNMQHNLMSSFSAYNASLEYFEQLKPCEKVLPDMYKFIAGMYYSLGGYMKKEHPALFFFGFDDRFADQQKGYALLTEGIHSENLQVQTESTYFFMKLYADVEKNHDAALKYADKLIEKFPDNLVFRYNAIQLLHSKGANEQMQQEFNELKTRAARNIQLSEKQQSHFCREFDRLIK